MRKVENAVQESHDYVSCQEQTPKHKDYQKKQRDVNQEYHDDKSFKNIKTTKVLFEKALK
jgi:hypothetical protein